MMRTAGFFLILFITHILQALAGFGGTMLAMPPSILLVGADTAKAVLNMAAWALSLMIVGKEYRHINRKELIRVSAGMMIGMWIGMRIYEQFPLDVLLKVYGALILVIAVKNLFFQAEEDRQLPKPVLLMILLAAGIIHGMFVSGGALLVVYMSSIIREKGEFRATVSAVWVVLDTVLMVTQIRSGLFTGENVRLMLWAMIPLAVSVLLGGWLHQRINQKLFSKLTYVLLIVSGGIALF